ncbi:MAG: radical SAM protein [Proteobacteria bacterium]|nr:radical SAM protein [Pseudomonadota bacterium]
MDLSVDDLAGRVRALYELASPCRLCPRACGADRMGGEPGVCGAGGAVEVAIHGPHFGEEPPLSGHAGSGTVFFSHCPVACVFCQNAEISHQGLGRGVSVDELAAVFLDLAPTHNLNLVTAGHFLPWVVDAQARAKNRGLDLPVVFNTGGYEARDTLRLLAGIVDVWLPDLKYLDPGRAKRYSRVEDYVPTALAALDEMVAQQGPLQVDRDGLARRGVLIRHLTLPWGADDTAAVLAWIAERYQGRVPVSLMAQYLPCHRADQYPELSGPVSAAEYQRAVDLMIRLGLEGFTQDPDAATADLIPDFIGGRMTRRAR